MLILQGLSSLSHIPKGGVLTVGNYDGVHLGHRRLLQIGRQLAGTAPLIVMTFEPHPLVKLRPQAAPPRLTPLETKRQLLASVGVDTLIELAPDPEVLSITAHDFFNILVNNMQVRHLVEGPDFNFGKGREGNIANLKSWASATPMQVHVVDELEAVISSLHIVEVRSSLIRWLLAHGRARDAAMCLGRPYILRGPVIKGFQRGRQLGMPTANIDCSAQLVPADGVYAGRCTIAGMTYPAGVSIGTLPTFNEITRQVEAHLLGFDGDLYGQTIEFELIEFLREQIEFFDLEQLKLRMWRDMDKCRELATLDPARPPLALSA